MIEPSKLRTYIDSWLKTAKQPEAAREALSHLFPKAAQALGMAVSTAGDDGPGRKLRHRISEREFAEAYFRLDPQPATWSRSEIDGFMTSGGADAAFIALNQRQEGAAPSDRARLRGLFLDALDGAFREGLRLSQSWLDAIVANSVELIKSSDDDGGMFAFSNMDRLRSILTRAIERIDPQQRAEIFLQTAKTAQDITLLTDLFRGLAGDINPEGYQPKTRTVDFGDQTEAIRTLLLKRIRSLAHSGEIWDQAEPGHLIWFWWGSGDRAEIVTFTNEALTTEKGLTGLLDIPVSLVRSTGGNYERINEKSWSDIVDLELIDELARKIIESPEEDPKKPLAIRYRAALQRSLLEDD